MIKVTTRVTRLVLGLVGLLLSGMLLMAGCGGSGADGGSLGDVAAPGTPGTVHAVQALPESDPSQLRIDAIDATSTLIPLGLNDDGTIEVPSLDQPGQAGWYRYGPTPGELGPAVVLGHVNSRGQDGIFARLSDLEPGDQVSVDRSDGHTATFTVTRVEQLPKSRFPTEEVYGDTTAAELRLITCGGELDRARHSYQDNIIVYAVLTAVQPA